MLALDQIITDQQIQCFDYGDAANAIIEHQLPFSRQGFVRRKLTRANTLFKGNINLIITRQRILNINFIISHFLSRIQEDHWTSGHIQYKAKTIICQ